MDYNIYIRSLDGGGSANPTTPWKMGQETQTTSWQAPDAREVISTIANPDTLVAKGVGAVMKAVPWVALAFAVVKGAQSVYSDIILPHETMLTGDYRQSVAYSNFQNTMHQIFAPISHAVNYQKAKLEMKIENDKRTQNRLLLGDSELNSYTGVGV